MNSAIIYARISSPNQGQFNGKYTSLENQIEHGKKYCGSHLFGVQYILTEVVSGRDINKQTEKSRNGV